MANKNEEKRNRRERHWRVIDGQLYARFVYTDASGKRREKHEKAESKTDARERYDRMKREHFSHGEQILDAARMTFRQLAAIYEQRRLIPAEYQGERRVAGRRSLETPKGYLRTLVGHFGGKRVRNIAHSDLDKFRRERLKTPIIAKYKEKGKEKTRERPRTIASVNRELEVLRSVLNFAKREGWIIRNPFETGEPLISKADEVQRDRILTCEEEERLLSVCTGRRSHLRLLLIAALDTGMRRGELFALKWSDVDFENRLISVRATTTKTMRGRIIGLTARLQSELAALWENSAKGADSLVFGITDTVKTAFAAACREAGVEGFRLHDARHTAITRMIQGGMPPMEVMKISGHTQMTTFVRYVNADSNTAQRAAAALDALHQAIEVQPKTELVN